GEEPRPGPVRPQPNTDQPGADRRARPSFRQTPQAAGSEALSPPRSAGVGFRRAGDMLRFPLKSVRVPDIAAGFGDPHPFPRPKLEHVPAPRLGPPAGDFPRPRFPLDFRALS